MDWFNSSQLMEDHLKINTTNLLAINTNESSSGGQENKVTDIHYIPLILFAIIFVVGVIGNGTLIIVFLFHRSMRNIPNM